MSGKSNLAQEYRISKMLIALIDKASKFLSAGKTNLHGHAQGTSKSKDTLMVSHKPEETLDALSHEQMGTPSYAQFMYGDADSKLAPSVKGVAATAHTACYYVTF
ncbi:hypothetical protein D1007_18133 [Hordeum vulgare]|nr:hypothetical protein D1007_18133 [Hordeum vulgare]